MNKEYSGECFFILSKGNNAGKPLIEPCANCFVFLADDAVERERFYWLCQALWQAGFFRRVLTGTAIPFIHLADLQQLITMAGEKLIGEAESIDQVIGMITTLAKYQDVICEQLQRIKRAQRGLMYRMLK